MGQHLKRKKTLCNKNNYLSLWYGSW